MMKQCNLCCGLQPRWKYASAEKCHISQSGKEHTVVELGRIHMLDSGELFYKVDKVRYSCPVRQITAVDRLTTAKVEKQPPELISGGSTCPLPAIFGTH